MATYLREASVTGLYGDRDLQVRIPATDSIAFIHGPNGIGKSTLLRLLLNLLTLNFASLARIPFSAASVTVRMDDADPARDFVVEVRRASDDWSLTVTIDGVAWPVEVFTAADERAFTAYLEEFLPELVLLPNGRWWDERTAAEFTLREVLTVVADRAPTGAAPRLGYDPALAEAMPAIDVEYIGADRLRNDLAPLLRRERDAFALSGETASGAGYPGAGGSTAALFRHRRALAQGIADARSEAATLARSLDQTFPSRLVADADPASALSDAELATAFAALDAEYQALARLGLVEAVGQSAPQLPAAAPEWMRMALSLWLADARAKLDPLRALGIRIELFLRLARGKLADKEFQVDAADGFVIRTASGHDLSPSALSSGEQHQLLLLYRMIFRDSGRRLFLIDEPEISLHVGWQEEFVADLLQIAAINDSQFLLATHSPLIIGDRYDLLVDVTGADSP